MLHNCKETDVSSFNTNLNRLPEIWSALFIKNATQFNVLAGRNIILDGDNSTNVYFIMDGRVEVSQTAPNGKVIILREMGTGFLLGELSALDYQARSATVIALENCTLARMTAEKFREILVLNPEFSIWLNEQLASLVRDLTTKHFQSINLSIAGRILNEVMRLCAEHKVSGDTIIINQFPTHANLAARLGTNRETVTKELRSFAAEGILIQSGRQLTVKSVAKMHSILSHLMS